MRKLVLALAIGAVLATATVAVASIPDSTGIIHGCYDAKSGALRVIDSDAGQTCAKGETALSWSQTGPPGPAGITAVHLVSQLNGPSPTEVFCPTGETALSATWDSNGRFAGAQSISWVPLTDSTGKPVGYRFWDTYGAGFMYDIVTCATTS